LKSDKFDGIQVDRQKRVIDRSGEFTHIPGFIPQQFVESTQEPDIVDCEISASSFRHDSYRLWTGVTATQHTLRSMHEIYTSPLRVTQAPATAELECRLHRKGCPDSPGR
jgi:hypothetical protein